jgi:hypothetical protein
MEKLTIKELNAVRLKATKSRSFLAEGLPNYFSAQNSSLELTRGAARQNGSHGRDSAVRAPQAGTSAIHPERTNIQLANACWSEAPYSELPPNLGGPQLAPACQGRSTSPLPASIIGQDWPDSTDQPAAWPSGNRQ